MKRILALISAAALVLSLASCARISPPSSSGEQSEKGQNSTEPEKTTPVISGPVKPEETKERYSLTRSESFSRPSREYETSAKSGLPDNFKPAGEDLRGYDDWGLKPEFECTDGKNGTFTFYQSTRAGMPPGELTTGASFTLKAREDGAWLPYDYYVRKNYDRSYKDPNPVFIMIAYQIPLDDKLTLSVDFTSTYGKLYPGTYRLIKKVTSGTEPLRLIRDYYVEFTVE